MNRWTFWRCTMKQYWSKCHCSWFKCPCGGFSHHCMSSPHARVKCFGVTDSRIIKSVMPSHVCLLLFPGWVRRWAASSCQLHRVLGLVQGRLEPETQAMTLSIDGSVCWTDWCTRTPCGCSWASVIRMPLVYCRANPQGWGSSAQGWPQALGQCLRFSIRNMTNWEL